jgi:Cu-processing system permease protein
MNKLLIIASKEFKDGFRNRWIIAITLMYAIFSLGLTYFGSAASGTVGFASLETTIISLASLAVILIPLIALMLAYNAFVGEYEQGTMLLLLTYPISRTSLLLGKFFGQAAIMLVSAIIGFGVAVVALIAGTEISPGEALPAFAWFIASASLLGWIFIAIAYVISLSVSEKSQAAGLALVVWFFFVLVYDLGLLALLVADNGSMSTHFLSSLLLFNPTDVFRLINYQAVNASEYSGVLQLAQGSGSNLFSLTLVMLAWIIVPLILSAVIFKKREV